MLASISSTSFLCQLDRSTLFQPCLLPSFWCFMFSKRYYFIEFVIVSGDAERNVCMGDKNVRLSLGMTKPNQPLNEYENLHSNSVEVLEEGEKTSECASRSFQCCRSVKSGKNCLLECNTSQEANTKTFDSTMDDNVTFANEEISFHLRRFIEQRLAEQRHQLMNTFMTLVKKLFNFITKLMNCSLFWN